MSYRPIYPNELYHYGILGQKWGVRRFQNPDGTLTDAGKKRYFSNGTTDYKKLSKDHRKGLVNADSMIRSKFGELSDNELKDYVYRATNLAAHTKGAEREMLDRIGMISMSEIERRSSEAKSREINSLPEPKSKGATSLDADAWGEKRSKMLRDALHRMEYSSRSDEEKDRRIHSFERARDNDSFDVNFLEAIQNSKIFYNDDLQAIMIEYAYYLADPAAYMMNRRLEGA